MPHASRPRARPRAGLLALVFLGAGVASPPPLEGQWIGGHPLQDLLVPAGHVRLGFEPSFTSWDSRFGMRTEAGGVVEEEEPLGADLTDQGGAALFPGLLALQEQLRVLTGDAGYAPDLGTVRGRVTKDVTRLDFGLHVGVFDWLTVGATLPWVRTRTAVDVGYVQGGADLGLNPVIEENSRVSSYLGTLDGSASAASARADALCAASDPGCDGARTLAQRARDHASALRAAYFASPFFPASGTDAATALLAAHESLAAGLVGAGLGAPGAPIFAGAVLDAAGFSRLPTDPGVGIQTTPFASVDPLWAAGDVEINADVRILEGEVRAPGAERARFAWSLAGGGLVRLGTGTQENPDILLHVGTGDAQMDVEGRVQAGLRVGGSFGVRAGVRYGVQGATTLLRRVAAPEQVLAPIAATRAVRWTPGAYLDVAVSPRWHLSDVLALALDYRLFHKGADTYELAAPAGDGSDPSPALLAAESEVDAQELAVGLRYSTLAGWRRGAVSPPVELSARFVTTVAGSGGQTPVATRADFAIRLFRSLWGG